MKHDLQRRRYTEEARRVTRRQGARSRSRGCRRGNLRPWREVVMPHPDVATGQYQQAEFAADLHQVWRDEAEDEYGKPEEFFRRTFLTEGLRDLLLNATRRLRGEGGDPVVQLQTNFGGGKTHSLIALYHLAGRLRAGEAAGRRGDARRGRARGAARGEARRPRRADDRSRQGARQKPDGTTVQTLWGELAWQLGGAEGYAIVESADKARTNPGDALNTLLERLRAVPDPDRRVGRLRAAALRARRPPGGDVRHADDVRAGALGRGQERQERDARRLHPGVGHRGRRGGGQGGARAALERHLPPGGLVEAGLGGGGVRDRPPAAVRGRPGRARARARRGRQGVRRPVPEASGRVPAPRRARGATGGGSSPPTRSIPSSSTTSSTTGRRSRSSSARAASCG